MERQPVDQAVSDHSSGAADPAAGPARFCLVMQTTDGVEREFELLLPKTVLGRMSYCDLQVALPTVGARHCELIPDGDGVAIRDLGSELGTVVNGMRIDNATLRHKDRLDIGPVRFQLRDRTAHSASMVPETTNEPQDTSSGSEVVVMKQGQRAPRQSL